MTKCGKCQEKAEAGTGRGVGEKTAGPWGRRRVKGKK